MEVQSKKNIEERLGYHFQNENLLEQALTHSSYVNENPGTQSNERLEFLGDAVLELAVSHWLFMHGDFPEGELSRIRAKYVCTRSLSALARKLKLGVDLRLSRGALKIREQENPAVLENLTESLFGAVYLDGGYDQAAKLITRHLLDSVDVKDLLAETMDAKSCLQEKLQTRGNVRIEYAVEDISGPSHQPHFTVSVRWDGMRHGTGEGSSKKEAEQRAAEQALQALQEQNI